MTEYIKGLRALVGHRPLLQCGASVIVENGAGEILLQLRQDNGCWGYAGGSVELDEPVEAAATRELMEETGLAALELTLFGVFSGPDMHYVYPNGDEVSNIDVLFVCRRYTGTLTPQSDEVAALRFFKTDALPEPISPPCQKGLRAYLAARETAR